MSRLSRWILPILILGLIGLVDATYLTVEHYRQGIVPCFAGTSCEVVTTSSYATIAGIPVALFGATYYLGIVIMSIAILEGQRTAWVRWLPKLTALGFIASIYFFSIQAFVLQAYCLYCLISAGTSTGLFATSLLGYTRMKTT